MYKCAHVMGTHPIHKSHTRALYDNERYTQEYDLTELHYNRNHNANHVNGEHMHTHPVIRITLKECTRLQAAQSDLAVT
jgi:hypothetical protein